MEKNNVSYFQAGYFAGLIDSGKHTAQELVERDFNSIEFPNRYRELLQAYDKHDEVGEALTEMFKEQRKSN